MGKLALLAGVCLALFVLAIPVVAIDYTYGGRYNDDVYPLVKAEQILDASESFIPYNPHLIATYAATAWALVNLSDNRSGAGSGSPCWIYPTPTQTYGYADSLLYGIIVSMSEYQHVGSFLLENTTFSTWGLIGQAIEKARSGLTGVDTAAGGLHDGISGCFWGGDERGVMIGIVWGLTGLGGFLFTVGAIVTKGRW